MTRLGPAELAAYVAARAARGRVLHLEQPTRTVSEAARALGVHPQRIVKSLLFHADDGQALLAIVRGDQRVDPERLARVAGKQRVELAPAVEVVAVTGYPAGATPPVGHRAPLPVFVDPAVLEESVVYGGGGDERSMLEIPTEDLVRLTGATVAPISRVD
ncbi:MAG: YbaK/EbsC family protein [Thermomicrobium sp.]|nr:YbaK/EbsC family protein [Thermomicrobium sp.]MDW8058652.1 YbaK/EbsC family protein [Thermomicrobium sp.]